MKPTPQQRITYWEHQKVLARDDLNFRQSALEAGCVTTSQVDQAKAWLEITKNELEAAKNELEAAESSNMLVTSSN